jgi:hypothetical protein
MALVIDSRAHNRHLIEQEVTSYLASLPDWDRWRDMFESSVGNVILDILCGISELLLYKMDNRLIEAYLYSAISDQAVYLIADMLGYNVNRKAAAEGKVTLTFESSLPSQVTIPDGYAIYTGDIPLVVVGNHVIAAGSDTAEIDVAQGEFAYRLFTSTPGEDYYLSNEALETSILSGVDFERLLVDEGFEVENASTDPSRIAIWACLADDNNNISLSSSIDWYRSISDLDSNSVLVKTYYEGGITILFGDGTYGKSITPSSLILVKYLKTLGSLGTIVINTDLDDITVAVIGGSIATTVKVSETITGGSDEDDLEKVRTVVAGYFATQERAVTSTDWIYVLESYQGVTDAQARKNSTLCCTVDAVCVTQTMGTEGHFDFSNPDQYWTATREANLLEYLEDFKITTTQVIVFDPAPVDFSISLTVTLSSGTVDQAALTTEIRDAVKSYCFKLDIIFHPTQLLTDLTNLNDYIKKVVINQIQADIDSAGYAPVADPYDSIDIGWREYFRVTDADIAISFEVDLS